MQKKYWSNNKQDELNQEIVNTKELIKEIK